MIATSKKRGRKPKPYVCPWNNETIDGLYLCKDGRWRIVETGEKFREADPRRAVARFRQWQSRQLRSNVLIPIPPMPANTDPDAWGAVAAVLCHELGAGYHHAPSDESLVLHVPANLDPVLLLRTIPEDVYYAHVAQD